MKTGFLIHGLIELLGGLILIFYPDIFITGDNATLGITKMYGILASSFGFIALILWRNHENSTVFKNIYLVFMGFHMFLSFHCYGLYKAQILLDLSAIILHSIVFALLTILYLKDVR